MYFISKDFHVFLQYRLRKWMARQTKLICNTLAGHSDDVITVNEQYGVTFDLIHFNE